MHVKGGPALIGFNKAAELRDRTSMRRRTSGGRKAIRRESEEAPRWCGVK